MILDLRPAGLGMLTVLLLMGAIDISGEEQRPQSSGDRSFDWPRWRGAHFNDTSTQEDVFFEGGSRLEVVWKKQIGTGYSSVSVAAGRAVTMFSDGESDFLLALDAVSGDELWRLRIDTTFPGKDGALDGPTSTPLIEGGSVFGLGPKGQLVAADLTTGQELWRHDLQLEFGAVEPHWGFTTSPLIFEDLLIVETGGPEGKSISAFRKKSGDLVWAAGSDAVTYQSPILAQLDGEIQVIYAGEQYLIGLRPRSGEELWKVAHGGKEFFEKIVNPVIAGPDKLFLMHGRYESKMLQMGKMTAPGSAGAPFAEIWSSTGLKQSYAVPIFIGDQIVGFSGSLLAGIDAENGELLWRNRSPGRGFNLWVDGHLVTLTRTGALHAAKVSREGYEEVASMQLFDRLVWSPPSFANGRIYARSSFGEVASVRVLPGKDERESEARTDRLVIPGSKFQDFIDQVDHLTGAGDKATRIDSFMESQSQFPIIEGNTIAHIVYRGPGEELILGGDLFTAFGNAQMNRVEGTDFFYASVELQPDARITYYLERDTEGRMSDPLNPREVSSPLIYGAKASELSMPAWKAPHHLEEFAGEERGRLETVTFFSSEGAEPREATVYLPRGYDQSLERYPVLYVHYGNHALETGKMANSLDHLIGTTIDPIIGVFVAPANGYEYARSQKEEYARLVVEELVPFIDRTYRTQQSAESRAIVGGDEGGFGAFFVTFRHPGVFGKVAGQSVLPIGGGERQLLDLVESSQENRIQAYLDWGRYDFRNPTTDRDVREYGRTLAEHLTQAGHQVRVLEAVDGAGFASWRNRADAILETFFPSTH